MTQVFYKDVSLMAFKPIPAAIAILVGLINWFFIPTGVTPEAWHMLALFIATIVAIIGKVLPIDLVNWYRGNDFARVNQNWSRSALV